MSCQGLLLERFYVGSHLLRFSLVGRREREEQPPVSLYTLLLFCSNMGCSCHVLSRLSCVSQLTCYPRQSELFRILHFEAGSGREQQRQSVDLHTAPLLSTSLFSFADVSKPFCNSWICLALCCLFSLVLNKHLWRFFIPPSPLVCLV